MYKWNRERLIEYAKAAGFKTLEEEEIKPGDSYIAGRNTKPQLLTCAEVDKENGWIRAVEVAYSYDIHECIKVTC